MKQTLIIFEDALRYKFREKMNYKKKRIKMHAFKNCKFLLNLCKYTVFEIKEKKLLNRKNQKKYIKNYQVSQSLLCFDKSDKEQGSPSQQNIIAIGIYCDSNGHRCNPV